ncbi:hypothetical protein NKG05_05080 [Oerskovia sp. M15]
MIPCVRAVATSAGQYGAHGIRAAGARGPGPQGEPSGTARPPAADAASAWRSAREWQEYARTQVGPTQQHALAAAAHWYGVHLALASQEAAAQGTGAHGAEPASAGRPWHGAQAPTRRRRPGVALAVGLSLVLVGTIVVGLVVGVTKLVEQERAGAFAAGPTVPTIDDWIVPAPTPDAAGPDAAGPGTGPGTPLATGMEEGWKRGDYAVAVPPSLLEGEAGTPFLAGNPDATGWLADLNPANEGLLVVFTDDETYNCGMQWILERDMVESGVAGCYNPDYPTTLFMYWGPEASPESKEFVLAHELSHLMQWWHHFDVVQSAAEAALSYDEAWTEVVEADATCRVLSWGGYSQEAADSSSSPCTATEWSEGWLASQAEQRG